MKALADHLGLKVVVDKAGVRVERPKGNVLSSQADLIARLGERVRALEGEVLSEAKALATLAEHLGVTLVNEGNGWVIEPRIEGRRTMSRLEEYRGKEADQRKAATLVRKLAKKQVGFVRTTLEGAAWKIERSANIWKGLADKEKDVPDIQSGLTERSA